MKYGNKCQLEVGRTLGCKLTRKQMKAIEKLEDRFSDRFTENK